MKHAYVTALTESVLAGQPIDDVLTRTKARMEQHGHLRLYSQVLKAAARSLSVKLRQHSPQVSIATENGVSADTIKLALERIGAADVAPIVTVDETLVGGLVTRFKGTVLDQSYKRALITLYRTLTK